MPHPKYKEEHCSKLISHMKKGHSFASFASEIGVSRNALYKWVDAHPEFADAKGVGEAAALKFWESLLIANACGQNIANFDQRKSDVATIIFALKTRFYQVYGVKPDFQGQGTIEDYLKVRNENKGDLGE